MQILPALYYSHIHVQSHINFQLVPIPCVTHRCNNDCCTRLLVPLSLAFAKTIDTFQGQNAGPVDPGKPPNPIQRVICDPGS